MERLDEARILLALSPKARSLLADFILLPVVDSTNAELLRHFAGDGEGRGKSAGDGEGRGKSAGDGEGRGKSAGKGLVCTAEQQTAGRGRRGRHWASPFGANLYASVGWQFASNAGGAAALGGLSLAVGVATAEALEDCGVTGCSLKWPNDILFEGAKLGGILIEMAGGDARRAVGGVGLSVNMPAEAAQDIGQAWTDIAQVKKGGVSRNLLLAALLDRLLPLLEDYESKGFAPWREAWSRRDAFLGREVHLSSGRSRIHGTCLGVTGTGALRLLVDGGEQVFHGGEISLRAAD